ncbi:MULTISPECIES: hypothetical protein [unclassified Mycobacterium]|uniref:hypothetical protein n=1 Tax=unclassified Mycobacterium TaxID=2642494 RepID=UPI000A63DE99|nr:MULTISPECIES: hypothetical protein [unclassified Mycobacterium]
MTAHLAWPQPQYERIRAGLSPRLWGRRSMGVVCLGEWIQKGSGTAEAVEEN